MGVESGRYVGKGDFYLELSQYWPNLNQTASSTWSERDSVTGSWSRTSSTTLGFRDPKRVGRLKPLPFTYTSTKYQMAAGHWVSSYLGTNNTTNRNSRQYGYFGSTLTAGSQFPEWATGVNVPVMDRLRAVATNKLLGKIKSSTMNLAVTMAERDKTANTITNAVNRMSSAMRHLRRGNIGQAAEAFGGVAGRRQRSRFSRQYARDVETAVASGWLELQYGWKPILYDVYGAAEALARNNLMDSYVTTRHRESYTEDIDKTLQTYSNGRRLVSSNTIRGARRTDVLISCTYFRPRAGVKSLSEIGITNPALVAWELVPYSFVVDWVLPIGSWLDTFDATLGLEFHSGFRTEFTKKVYLRTDTQVGVDAYNYQQNMFRRGGEEYVRCQRIVLSGFPSPAIPRFKDPSSLSHLATALALFSNIFRRKQQ